MNPAANGTKPAYGNLQINPATFLACDWPGPLSRLLIGCPVLKVKVHQRASCYQPQDSSCGVRRGRASFSRKSVTPHPPPRAFDVLGQVRRSRTCPNAIVPPLPCRESGPGGAGFQLAAMQASLDKDFASAARAGILSAGQKLLAYAPG